SFPTRRSSDLIKSSAPFHEHHHLKDKNKQLFVSQNNDYLKLDYGICNIPVRMGILYERRIQMVDSQEMVIHLVTQFFPVSFPIRDLGSGWQIEAHSYRGDLRDYKNLSYQMFPSLSLNTSPALHPQYA